METQALREAATLIGQVADRTSPIRLSFAPGQITVEAGAGDEAQASETVPAIYDGEPFAVSFNPAFLLDGLTVAGRGFVRFSFTTPSKPAVLTGHLDPTAGYFDGFRYLMMPLRVPGQAADPEPENRPTRSTARTETQAVSEDRSGRARGSRWGPQRERPGLRLHLPGPLHPRLPVPRLHAGGGPRRVRRRDPAGGDGAAGIVRDQRAGEPMPCRRPATASARSPPGPSTTKAKGCAASAATPGSATPPTTAARSPRPDMSWAYPPPRRLRRPVPLAELGIELVPATSDPHRVGTSTRTATTSAP